MISGCAKVGKPGEKCTRLARGARKWVGKVTVYELESEEALRKGDNSATKYHP